MEKHMSDGLVFPIQELITRTGEDVDREGLRETPERFLKAWDFWTQGYKQNPFTLLKTFEDGASKIDEMIFQGNIPFWSLCEHHLAPFFGVVHIGYIPQGRIIGLSKFARLVDVFARRLQCQERMGMQIATTLFHSDVKPRGVGVVIRARHSCMESRGVQKAGTITYTSMLCGDMREHQGARSEFLQFVKQADVAGAII
jgi:GTP cyclohydrolase IA